MPDRRIATRFGLLDVDVWLDKGGRYAAKLTPPGHIRLSAVGGAMGDTADDAVAHLANAVERWGADFPLPPKREHRQYVVAELAVPVTFVRDDVRWSGYAVAWTDTEVWVSWSQGHGDDRSGWVPAGDVERG